MGILSSCLFGLIDAEFMIIRGGFGKSEGHRVQRGIKGDSFIVWLAICKDKNF